MTEYKNELEPKLVRYIGAFLLLPQEAQVNVQKMVDVMSLETKSQIYALITAELSARVKSQINTLSQELGELS